MSRLQTGKIFSGQKEKNKENRRLPLYAQLMMIMCILAFTIIILFGIFNNLFLEQYYRYNKQKEVQKGYDLINEAAAEDILSDEDFDVPFEKICANGNISIIVLGNDRRELVRSSLNDFQDYQMEMFQLMNSSMNNAQKVITTTPKYSLALMPDERMGGDYLILVGMLDNGDFIYMRTAIESLRESAAITSRFFLLAAMIGILVCIVLSYFLSRMISRPILELKDISEHMTNLEFDVRYQSRPGASRETDQLGCYMNKMSESLEETISELKVANNQLQQDIQKKEEIDEMRKEFLSNVSHELKTPLALIQGYAEGLQECINDDPESRDFYCEVIIDETGKMNHMVKKLLTLNALEFGNDTVEMERFDVTELIRGVVSSQELMAEQKGITITCMNEESAYVWGDVFKVEEVISNYLSNAIHYAAGEKQIRIFYTRHDNLLRVSVFNTGSHIPEEDLDKVWIKFFKVDKARTREYGGSGIGLSIVKAIMDSFHQKCGVLNHEDGVEFWMELEMK